MASIPLPALAIQQPPSYLDQYGKLLSIQQLLGNQKTQQLQQTGLSQENQQRALELQDAQTLRSIQANHVKKDANGNIVGYDNEGFVNDAAAKGVNPNTLAKLRASYLDIVQKTAAVGKEQIDLEDKKNKNAYEILEGVRGIKDPAQRQAAYQSSIPKIQALGVDPTGLPQTADDEAIKSFEAHLGMHAQILADAKTQAETAEKQQQTATSKAQQEHTEMETRQGGPPEVRELNDWLAKNPGKGASDYVAWKAKQAPLAQIQVLNATTGAGKPAAEVAKQFGMTPEAFDQAAEKYFSTGVLPQAGRGMAGAGLQRAIMNRTAELHQGASLAEGSAEYKANADSLKKLQGNLDAVSAFENTALKNLQLFREQAKKVIDTGIPLLNAPIRSAAKMLGNENQAGFETALQVANNEIAKVTSSPGLSGVLSDSARKEVEAYNPKNATVGQAMHVADILEKDMANRHESYAQQIADIKTRLGGKNEGKSGNAGPSKTSGGFSVTAPNGKTYSFPDQASLDRFKQAAGIK